MAFPLFKLERSSSSTQELNAFKPKQKWREYFSISGMALQSYINYVVVNCHNDHNALRTRTSSLFMSTVNGSIEPPNIRGPVLSRISDHYIFHTLPNNLTRIITSPLSLHEPKQAPNAKDAQRVMGNIDLAWREADGGM